MNPTPTWRRLFAAALLAAVFSFPARADDARDTAGDAAKALHGDKLEQLYTGNVYRNDIRPPVPVPPQPNGPAPRLAPPGLTPQTIPQADIDRCLVSSNLGAEDKKFYQEMVAKLQTSDHGHEILQKLVDDCIRTNQPTTIKAPAWEGSAVVNTNGLEGIYGLGGQSWDNNGKERVFEFNHKFLEFKKHDVAVNVAAGIMGHELTHLDLHVEYRQLLPEYADVLGYAMLDEQNARVRGFLVDYELAAKDGEATGDTENAAWLANHPQQFFDSMKLWNKGYAIALQQSELREATATYKARITMLETYIKRRQEELDEAPTHLAQIDHMTQAHADVLAALKQQKPLGLLRDNVAHSLETLPKAISECQEGIDNIKKMIARLEDGASGAALQAKMTALSYDPAFADLVARHEDDIDLLKKLVDEKKLHLPPADEFPMEPAFFGKLFEAMHGNGSIKQKSGWKELNLPIDELRKDYEFKSK